MRLYITDELCAKLSAGGTTFQSRDYGFAANSIFISMSVGANIALTVGKDQQGDESVYSGSMAGTMSSILFLGGLQETFTAIADNTGKFVVVGSISGALGYAYCGKVFRSSQLAFVITSKNHLQGDMFTMRKSFVELYTGTSFSDLRGQVQQSSSLIWMPEQLSIDGEPQTFAKTYLSGGSGLPKVPHTDLILPMAFVNYRETMSGTVVAAEVYSWAGTPIQGTWIKNLS